MTNISSPFLRTIKTFTALYLLACIVCFTNISLAQKSTIVAVPLIENRTYELDGGIVVLHPSRAIIAVDLPPNTVEWYYVFRSNSNQESVNSKKNGIELASQLTRIIDQSGTTATALSMLLAPTGSCASNVYLFDDYQNASYFVNKTDQDLFSPSWKFYSDYSILSAKQGKQKVNLATAKKYYLGIQAGSSPVNVDIEVVAIVDQSSILNNGWTSDNRKIISDILVAALEADKIPREQANSLTSCIVESIVKDYPSDIFFGLTEQGLNSILEGYLAKCYQEEEGFNKTEEQQKAVSYGNMGWQYYENGEIDKAIEYSIRALELQKDLGYVKANLGLFYLIKGEEIKANDYYISALVDLKKNKLTGKGYLKAAIDDIDNAKKEHSSMKGHEAIWKELKREYDSWIN